MNGLSVNKQGMIQATRIFYIAFGLMLINWISGCGGSSSSNQVSTSPQTPTTTTYRYQVPAATGDGWQVASLVAKGIDPLPLENLINNIKTKQTGFLHIDSLVIAQNGELLLEQQLRNSLDLADGWASNQDINLHVVNSVTKSFTSALVGIAIDQGLIANVNVPVHDFFQHKLPVANWSEDKQAITIENWLNMRHGYLWDEWNVSYLNASNLNSQMNNAADPIQFLLSRPMATKPGSTFAYSTGVSYGLGRIIQLVSGLSFDQYLQTYLLTPLNITSKDFWSLDGQLHSGSALYLKTRDMAKFGQLFLDGGIWNGERIISQEWVEQSTIQRVDLNQSGTVGYGYQWWMRQFQVGQQILKCFYASGYGGQFIYVFPEINLVIAMTGSAYLDGQSDERDIRTILEQSILPSFINGN